jgi:hypothetical protein
MTLGACLCVAPNRNYWPLTQYPSYSSALTSNGVINGVRRTRLRISG